MPFAPALSVRKQVRSHPILPQRVAPARTVSQHKASTAAVCHKRLRWINLRNNASALRVWLLALVKVGLRPSLRCRKANWRPRETCCRSLWSLEQTVVRSLQSRSPLPTVLLFFFVRCVYFHCVASSDMKKVADIKRGLFEVFALSKSISPRNFYFCFSLSFLQSPLLI
jgi:hypothetical protein